MHDGPHHHAVPDGDQASAAALEAAFVAGFRAAPDRHAFLRLAGVRFEIERPSAAGLKLVEVRIDDAFEVGVASPGFGSAELVYQPLPGAMIRQRTRLAFVYVSLSERRDVSLEEARGGAAA